MKNAENTKSLLMAMSDFKTSYYLLKMQMDKYEQTTGASVNDLPGFTESYPFDKSFDELAISDWVDTTVNSIKKFAFKVLSYEYLNTGGNCMVGIFEVWLPNKNRVVYMLTNEEGCNMSTVDYIRNELDIDDYDELILEYVDWGRITGYEEYFELYRYCLNEYTKSDCKHFGYTRALPYFLLSDELQKQVTAEYKLWLEAEECDLIDTNGEKIIESAFYEYPSDDEKFLATVKAFQRWHDSIAACEEYYSEDYILTFAGNTVRLPFVADVWDAVDHMLTSVIKNY